MTATPASNRSTEWDRLARRAHAWQLRPDRLRAPGLRDWWLSRLPASERAQYERFLTDEMRERYLAARVLCRTTLSRYADVDPCDWRFGENAHGKPAVLEPREFDSLRFNITHTRDLVICIVTRAGEVGVDAEDTSQQVDASLVARHFLSHREESRLARLPEAERKERFFEQWVLKEAYVKAIGIGLSDEGERLTVEQHEDGRVVAAPGCTFSIYRPSADRVAAAAVLARDSVAVEWRTTIW